MMKPLLAAGYDDEVTALCERVLVTLIRGLGPWRDSIFLIGGLTPRYLVGRKPPEVPAHAGTGDIDIVIQLHMLADLEAYHTLEDNFKKLGFVRGKNSKGMAVSWRWEIEVDIGRKVILELLADDPDKSGGKIMVLPSEGNVSALNIPFSGIVFDHYVERSISAQVLGDNGIATVTLRHADILAFTCLKAYAIDQRDERKDAHDLLYCLEHHDGGLAEAAERFRNALGGKHDAVVRQSLKLISAHFAGDATTEGYLKTGPVAVSKFELGEDTDSLDDRILRQRQVTDLIEEFLEAVGL